MCHLLQALRAHEWGGDAAFRAAKSFTENERGPKFNAYDFDSMSPRVARLHARRRAFVLVCLVALVWCQMVVAAHASSMAVAQLAADQVATQMALMPDCDAADGSDQERKSHCPTAVAMPDWSKLSVLHALPMPNVFVLLLATERGFAGPVHYGLPRGRAPPRAQLCCWLI